jgi:hypothetical protein
MGMGMAHHHEHDESGAVVSRAQRSTKRSEVARCRTGIVAGAMLGTIPDQQCITLCCTASGKRHLDFAANLGEFNQYV